MDKVVNKQNEIMSENIQKLSEKGIQYWSVNGNSTRSYSHIFYQYPAMMIPRIQKELIEKIVESDPAIKNVLDPFVGSGTTMVETMFHGLNFVGQDINPLAILLCKTKRGPFFIRALQDNIELVKLMIDSDRLRHVDIDFHNIDKWFTREIQYDLSRIRRSIQRLGSKWARRFLWVALAETIRRSSNSRTSTFKLHIRPQQEIESSNIDVLERFFEIVDRNYRNLIIQVNTLKEKSVIRRGRYLGNITILHTDSSRHVYEDVVYDLIITSPPYGDNLTTVPYGQSSYLPLQWIPMTDIDRNLDTSWIRTTQEIDRKSLGGVRTEIADEDIRNLSEQSPTLSSILLNLMTKPKDRRLRVACFYRDLVNGFDKIVPRLKDNGLMVLTVGNRRVGGQVIPMDRIVPELLESKGMVLLNKFERRIPQKRMAFKNSDVITMVGEVILFLRKCEETR